jgi:CBS domain containing-hemolysin-like protein
MMPAQDAFERLGLRTRPEGDFHTIAGFVLFQLELAGGGRELRL